MSEYDFCFQGSRQKGVLLVHGLTGSPAEMRFVGKQLHRAGFTVYAPTLAGHCQDMKALTDTRYEDWLASLMLSIAEFSTQVEEIYLAGICVGGGLALYAAHQASPAVKGVVIYSPTLHYDGWNVPFYYPLASRLTRVLGRVPLLNRVSFGEAPPYGIKSERVRRAVMSGPDGIAGTLPRFPAKGLYQNFRLNQALVKALPQIKVPTLLIHAREDDVSHPRNALTIQRYHGGQCDITWLEDSYHMVHVDQERQKVAQLTAEFFGIPETSADLEAMHG